MNTKKSMIASMIFLILFFQIFPLTNSSAEGESVILSISTESSTVNIGKTFNITLMAKPNMNVDIQGFDAKIKFDSSKLNLVKEGENPKITKPSGVHSSYLMGATVTGDEINIFCEDPTLASPIKARGSTALITFTFTVKENAATGSTAAFSLVDGSVTTIYLQIPQGAQTELAGSTSVTIGPKLDTNNYLSSLSVEGYVLSPAFAKDVYDYKVTVPTDVTSVTVNAQREASTSTHAVSGAGNLNYGDNMVTVTVTAQDTERTRRYRITVAREFPPQETSEEPVSTEPVETPSISESSGDITPTMEVTPEPVSSEPETDEDPSSEPLVQLPVEGNYWKTIAIISTVLFLICAGVMIWLIFDKISNKDKIVRIKRK